MGRRVTLGLAVAVLAVAGLLPLLAMLVRSMTVDGWVSLAAYRGLLASRREWTLLGHSLFLALSTALPATAAGVPLGILLGRTDLPFRRLFAVLFTLPLLLPPYIVAVAWSGLLPVRGLPGCTLVLFATFLPIPLLLTMAFAQSVDPRLEEAARLVSGWPRVLTRITLPLILPGILLSALLVFLLALGEFGVPAFLRYDVFAVESFARFSAFYDFGAATAAALPLVAITLLALVAERIFLREKTAHLQPGGGRSATIRLRSSRGWIAAGTGLLCFGLVAMPLLALFFQSLEPGIYREAFARAGASLLRSIAYAAVGASALTLLGFPIGYLIQTRALRLWRAVDSLTLFLFALSGTVIGIGLIGLWNHPATNFVYGTPILIVLGYLARYTALTQRIAQSALGTLPPSMEEAAQVAGAGWFRRTLHITIPLARRGLATGWLVGYIFCLRDLGVTMLVYPPGHDTLPVRIFTLMANGSDGLVAALCIIMIFATLLPLGLGGIAFKRWRHTA